MQIVRVKRKIQAVASWLLACFDNNLPLRVERINQKIRPDVFYDVDRQANDFPVFICDNESFRSAEWRRCSEPQFCDPESWLPTGHASHKWW